jgi:uncharacterized membrane protein YfcA
MIVFLGAILAGVITGMGMGGGILLVPLLVLFTRTSQLEAQGLCLAFSLPTSALAAWWLRRQNKLETTCAKKLVPWTLCGALPGALLASWLSPAALQGLFGLFLLFLGGREIYGFWQKRMSRAGRTRTRTSHSKSYSNRRLKRVKKRRGRF